MPTNKERAARVEAALDDVRAGKMIILVDDEDRENEGDLTMAAEKVTPEAINFMARYGRGLICLTLTEEKADALELPLQSARKGGGSPFGTAFTVSIEARRGVTTGISAKDRATTILTAVGADARPEDLITPGHVFPLRAKRGGVLVRTGQTEGSVDLARLAGLSPSGVICEIMNDDGSMARMPDLERFAAQHSLRILSIADLIDYRLQRESLVERRAEAPLTPTLPGVTADFRAVVYGTPVEKTEYLALTLGDLTTPEPVLVRVQTACFPGDVFGSAACDCGAQLRAALAAIERAGRGVFLYVYASGRQSLYGDVRAHVLHEEGATRVEGGEHKLRDFGLGAQVLSELGVRSIRLLTNNPKKIVGLEGYDLTVAERVPLEVGETKHNVSFLRDKRDREGHLLSGGKKE
ncbi:MAG TPA: 3,4-dihydroxy-2-butanone-4-phosphate synthase [Polyangia bacterium]|nr:3,4-dihydroxy-2-butanone-4-phosphate synthase [Polyangia bacterium]